MATGSLRFRTPHIEELPTTYTRQAPGFAWVTVSGPADDPAKNWGTTNRKRARGAGVSLTESQKEATSARRLRETERKIKELNSDGGRDVNIAIPKRHDDDASRGGPGSSRAGKTANTKKILASGKTFAHYLDDEEAEIARTGKRDGDLEVQAVAPPRASKTPIARRKPLKDDGTTSRSPAPNEQAYIRSSASYSFPGHVDTMDVDDEIDDEDSPLPPFPSQAEIASLLDAPPLTYNQARAGPPPPGAPPPRKFCEICGYWGRVRCLKCGSMTCSVACKDAHDEHKCLKFYA